jgi:propionyl-CoA synthetase
LRKIAVGESYKTPSTIDDESILPEISSAMQQAGLV